LHVAQDPQGEGDDVEVKSLSFRLVPVEQQWVEVDDD
jgi:hypothetical protein